MIFILQMIGGLIGAYVGMEVLKDPVAIWWSGVITAIVLMLLNWLK